jgi:hypothetical protein
MAVTFANFDWLVIRCPFVEATGIHEELFLWHSCVAQKKGRLLAVFTAAALTVDQQSLRPLARGQNSRDVTFRVEMIELKRTGDMPCLIMLVIASVNEEDLALLFA